jgi:hypothetical protein
MSRSQPLIEPALPLITGDVATGFSRNSRHLRPRLRRDAEDADTTVTTISECLVSSGAQAAIESLSGVRTTRFMNSQAPLLVSAPADLKDDAILFSSRYVSRFR